LTCSHTVGFRLSCGLIALLIGITVALAETTYTVQQGDTLSKIALRLQVSTDDLLSCNTLPNPDKLDIGQQLTVPDKAAPARAMTARELQEARQRLRARQQADAGHRIVTAARAYLGTRYRRGGLSSRGIDCSGLVVRAMAAQGHAVPHHSATLFRMGARVSYAQLQPGDLLFFNTNGRGVSHVGIWIGNNRFVHAASRGVREDYVAGYYARRLVGARRLH